MCSHCNNTCVSFPIRSDVCVCAQLDDYDEWQLLSKRVRVCEVRHGKNEICNKNMAFLLPIVLYRSVNVDRARSLISNEVVTVIR